MNNEDKQQYWHEVEDELVAVYNIDAVEARRRIAKLRYAIEHPPKGLKGMNGETVYHEDPLILAGELA